uniref:NB-ARC domain-containing protein n=1 Tax=Setaria viridis TaxID=4556 RepID=A0A4U6VG14_SETVI|nr:hypothetical protein SEVIR_3G267900v2 [Setaria viridis]
MAQLLSALLPGESLSTEFIFIGSIQQRRQKLHNLLLAINQVVSDAKEQAYKKPAVKSWIAQLKLAACDADNALDELRYEALHREALRHGHKINGDVRGFFSPHYNPLLFTYKIGKRLQQIFRFSIHPSMPMDERMRTHSYVDEQVVIRREGGRKKIVQMLLLGAESEKLSISCIVGIGGLGKITLAQLIFNDDEAKKGFQKHLWVCVSEKFRVPDIVKKVIDSAIGYDCGLKNDNMELLQQRLREELSRKRILFGSCGVGSAIIVTTRDLEVASIMGTVEPFLLEPLSEQDSWTLFSRRAFGMSQLESSDLIRIGNKIACKCQGVPLALKSIGGLMSTKLEISDWFTILESNTWEDEENPILFCFFCAVFPKDYEINKLEVIHLWIANGFIPSERTSDLEAKGHAIFSQLVWRSFFQDVKSWENYGYHDVVTFKIHDLMHDLAVVISGNESFDIHHLAYPHPHKIDLAVQHCRIIRSMFSLCKNLVTSDPHPNFTISTLRVLGLHIHQSKAFSFELAFMKHLRYLDLSFSRIKAIPEATSALYNLQVLMLNGCSNLIQLPEGMKYIVNLRHVYLDKCSSLMCMPAGLGQLSSLQTLTMYIVGDDPDRGIKEIRNLKLCGKLQIYGLMRLTNPLEAREADLETKTNIEQLKFCWGTRTSRHTQVRMSKDLHVDVSKEVFEALKLHGNLKVLEINQYLGTQFPRWMTNNMTLHKLVELTLIVWELPCLEVLQLELMGNLAYLCSSLIWLCKLVEEECSHSLQIFPKLKLLALEKMELLERWKETDVGVVSSVAFPLLDAVKIVDCPKLTALPKVPVLKSLIVKGNKALLHRAAGLTTFIIPFSCCNEESHDTSENKKFTGLSPAPLSVDPSEYEGPCNLESLDISDCPNLVSFPTCFACLKVLIIWGSSKLESIPAKLDCHNTLKLLVVGKCPSLKSMNDMQCLSNLRSLELADCASLPSLPEGMHDLVALTFVDISDCPAMDALPEGLLQRLPSLESFTVLNYPALVRKCKPGGDYWDRVRDIPELVVTDEASVQQHSAWQHAARALVSACSNAWYKILFCGQQLDNLLS